MFIGPDLVWLLYHCTVSLLFGGWHATVLPASESEGASCIDCISCIWLFCVFVELTGLLRQNILSCCSCFGQVWYVAYIRALDLIYSESLTEILVTFVQWTSLLCSVAAQTEVEQFGCCCGGEARRNKLLFTFGLWHSDKFDLSQSFKLLCATLRPFPLLESLFFCLGDFDDGVGALVMQEGCEFAEELLHKENVPHCLQGTSGCQVVFFTLLFCS